MNTPIRWVGSKRKLAERVTPHLDAFQGTYYEPFAGSAAMFFALEPQSAVVGDFNDELIGALQYLRDDPRGLFSGLSALSADADTYYTLRKQDSTQLTAQAQAIRFFFLNRHCFNGVYRTNRRGHFNVPMGQRTGSIPSERTWLQASELLRRADLRIGGFRETLWDVEEGDLAYLDPPYSEVATRHRGEFGYGGFTDAHVTELTDEMSRLNDLGCRVMVSFKQSEAFSTLANPWVIQKVDIGRRVAARVDYRRPTQELLITNFPLTIH